MSAAGVVAVVAGAAATLAGLGWLRGWVGGRLRRRADRLSASGRTVEAAAVWRQLASAWWASPATRSGARLNLGLSELERGALAEAEAWLTTVERPPFSARSGIAIAAIRLAQGRHGDAGHVIARLSGDPGARRFAAELDGVRALWVLRTDGPVAARALAERLRGPSSGELLAAVLWLCGGSEDPPAEATCARLAWLVPELSERAPR